MHTVYGVDADTVDFGPRETRRCEGCGSTSSFRLLLWYRFYHLFFVLGAVVERRHFLQCYSCGHALPTAEPTEFKTFRRIPLHRRYGLYAWLAFVLLVAIPVIVQEYSRL